MCARVCAIYVNITTQHPPACHLCTTYCVSSSNGAQLHATYVPPMRHRFLLHMCLIRSTCHPHAHLCRSAQVCRTYGEVQPYVRFVCRKLYPYATCTDIDCYAYAIAVFAVATPTPAPAPPTFHPCTYDLPLWCICLLPSLRALRWSWCAPWRGFLTRPAGPICKSSSALPFVASASFPAESNKYLVYPRLCCAAALPDCAQNP